MKKVLVLWLVVVMTLSMFAGCSSDKKVSESEAGAVELEKLRVAYHPNLAGCSSIITGINAGFFEEEGLEIELVKFTSGPPEIAAMVSGDIDMGYVGMGAHFLAMEGKVEIITVDLFANSDRVLATKESGIQSVADLKGKLVAVPLGTSGETVLELALEKEGIDKEDVELISMDVAGAVSAFISGKVDAAAVWAPYTNEIAKAVGEENIVEIAGNADFQPEYVFPSSWMATPEYVNRNTETVEKFLRALTKASEYRLTNPDEVVGWVSELIEVDEADLQADLPNYIFLTKEDMVNAVESDDITKWFTGLGTIFQKSGKIEEVVDPKTYINYELILNALK